MSQIDDVGAGGQLNSALPEGEEASKQNDAGEATGEKRGELLASLGPPCTGVAGEKVPEIFASAAKKPENRGRPTVMDDNLKTQVCVLLSVGLSRRQAATYLDIVHTTIANAMERDEEFAARVARAEQMSVIKPMLVVANASQKNWRAAAWLLARNELRVPRSEDEKDEAHQEELRRAREFNEFSNACMGQPVKQEQPTPVQPSRPKKRGQKRVK